MGHRSAVIVLTCGFALLLVACAGGEGDGGENRAVSSQGAGAADTGAPNGMAAAVLTAARDGPAPAMGNAQAETDQLASTSTPTLSANEETISSQQQWPVSLLLARGLSQRFGKRALSVEPFRQTASISATGGETDGHRSGLWSSWQWRMSVGHLVVQAYKVFGDQHLSSCEGAGSEIPHFARLGESGVALACDMTQAIAGKSSNRSVELKWSIEADSAPGLVRVCLTDYGCVRGDASGNLDTEFAPWSGAVMQSEGLVSPSVPTPMTLAWSLRNMVEQIRDGQRFELRFHQRWLPGAIAPVMVADSMTVTGREYPDGTKGLEFGDVSPVFALRIRMSHFGIAQWSVRDGNLAFDEYTEAMWGGLSGGFHDASLLEPVGSAGRILNLPLVPSSRFPAQWQTLFSIQADRNKACLNASRINPIGSSTWSWCWTHDPVEALLGDVRGRGGQDLYASSLSFLTD